MTKVIVLTAEAGLTDATLAAASEAAAAPFRRLGDRSAEATNDVRANADRLAAVREAVGDVADANAVPAEGRRKGMLIADMDSTIIPVECIDEIADFAGVKTRVADITERAMRGELDFEGALKERVGLLAGLPAGTLERVFKERITLNPGARSLVETMNANGAVTALVSGGFSYFTERVALAAGFSIHQANLLHIHEGRLKGTVAEPILGRAAKLEALLRISSMNGMEADDVIAVGDGANDLAMVEAAGLGVAYRAKPTLEAAADARLRRSDLTALLSLQGYREDEFRN